MTKEETLQLIAKAMPKQPPAPPPKNIWDLIDKRVALVIALYTFISPWAGRYIDTMQAVSESKDEYKKLASEINAINAIMPDLERKSEVVIEIDKTKKDILDEVDRRLEDRIGVHYGSKWEDRYGK